MPQLLVIVQVLIAQSQPIDALREHLGNRVFDLFLHPVIDEAAGQSAKQVDPPIDLAQKRRATVGRYLTGCEPGLNALRKMS